MMPINYKEYPENWKEISLRIRRDRAKNKCEWCGAENYAIGYRNGKGNFIFEERFQKLYYDYINNGWKKFEVLEEMSAIYDKKFIQIILTVAHLNHIKSDVRDENLAALCQRCHLLYDLPRHIRNRKYGKMKGQMEFVFG